MSIEDDLFDFDDAEGSLPDGAADGAAKLADRPAEILAEEAGVAEETSDAVGPDEPSTTEAEPAEDLTEEYAAVEEEPDSEADPEAQPEEDGSAEVVDGDENQEEKPSDSGEQDGTAAESPASDEPVDLSQVKYERHKTGNVVADEPYDWQQCSKSIDLDFLPEDQDPRGALITIRVSTHNKEPIMKTAFKKEMSSELPPVVQQQLVLLQSFAGPSFSLVTKHVRMMILPDDGDPAGPVLCVNSFLQNGDGPQMGTTRIPLADFPAVIAGALEEARKKVEQWDLEEREKAAKSAQARKAAKSKSNQTTRVKPVVKAKKTAASQTMDLFEGL